MKKMIVTIIVIIVIGAIVFIVWKFFMINTKDSVVDHRKYLGGRNNPVEIYAAPSDGLFYSPLNIDVVPMDKLMLVDIVDDPEYKSIELQAFDDSRGRGARVLLYHHEGPADVYYTNDIFEIMLTENAKYVTDPDIEYDFKVSESGLDASLKMKDSNGKLIEFRVKENHHKKWSKGFLAPIGGSGTVTFKYFPFFHMKDMNFVRRSGTEITIIIDGINRKPKKLPMPVNWEFVYLSRYTDAPIMACWNKPHNGKLLPLQGNGQLKDNEKITSYKLTDNSGHYEISRIIGFNEDHEASFDFSPPVPDLICLKDKSEIVGRFCAGAGSVQGIIAGKYTVKRQGNVIDMEIKPQKGWQPIPGRLWVKTWIWKSSITVSPDKTVSMKSSWIRKK